MVRVTIVEAVASVHRGVQVANARVQVRLIELFTWSLVK